MRWFSDSRANNLIYGVIFLMMVAALAVVGYMLNGWSFSDSLFMTVVTIFTVGYDEVRPLDTVVLRAITITLIGNCSRPARVGQATLGIGRPWRVRRIASIARTDRRRA